MRIVCWQTILLKYHSLFFSKIRKDVGKFVVCCSCDWRFKGSVPKSHELAHFLLELILVTLIKLQSHPEVGGGHILFFS